MAADDEVDPLSKLAFALGLLLVLVCVAVADLKFTWVVGPIAAVLFLIVLSRVRLLYGLLGIMYFSLTLENANDAPAAGMWRSPFFMVGFVFMVHLNMSTGISFLSFSGADAMLILLIIRTLIRGFTGAKLDSTRLTVPKPLMQLAMLSLAGGFFILARGMLRGGDFQKSLWQLERVTYTPIIFMLFQCAMRTTKDHVLVGKVFLAAASVRAALSIYVMNFAAIPGLEKPPWATTHHDSMLFACAIVILVSLVLHRATPAAWKLLLLLAPLIIYGTVENNRRTAWVSIPIVFVTLFFVMPNNLAKKKIKKLALYASPLWLAYLVVGWRSTNPIFKPVSSIRSVIEPAPDTSTLTRDIENYCLAKTIGAYPFLGLGYGHTFFQIIPLPPMPHPLEPWLPHNSLLGLWFAAGFVGYTMVTLLWAGGVFFGVRAYLAATQPMDRAVALVCFGSVLIYLVQCYADLGLGVMTAVYMVAPSIAIAGQLAMKTGAWPAKGAPGRAIVSNNPVLT
jgi:hypothetical protein